MPVHLKRLTVSGLVALGISGGLLMVGAASAEAAVSCPSTVNVYNTSGTSSAKVPANGTSTNCTLASGNTGNGVRALQRSLNYCYSAGLSVDGSFGPATKNALVNAQRSAGVSADGIYGPNTRDAIRHAYYQLTNGAFFTCGKVYI